MIYLRIKSIVPAVGHPALDTLQPPEQHVRFRVLLRQLFHEPGETYFPHKYLVYGHTPTPYYTGVQPEDARIYRMGKLIGIDCGCSSGGPLGCLCLDTLEEIYV